MSKAISDTYLYRAIGADIDGACGRCGLSRTDCMSHTLSRMDICGIIDDAPTIEAEPVKHGRWEWRGFNIFCSECDFGPYFDSTEPLYRYCPNCGAKMDKEEGEDA